MNEYNAAEHLFLNETGAMPRAPSSDLVSSEIDESFCEDAELFRRFCTSGTPTESISYSPLPATSPEPLSRLPFSTGNTPTQDSLTFSTGNTPSHDYLASSPGAAPSDSVTVSDPDDHYEPTTTYRAPVAPIFVRLGFYDGVTVHNKILHPLRTQQFIAAHNHEFHTTMTASRAASVAGIRSPNMANPDHSSPQIGRDSAHAEDSTSPKGVNEASAFIAQLTVSGRRVIYEEIV